ncbi:MAG: hypothetical protein AAFR90_09035 [Pseudomonadota bacterium]
MEHTSIRHETLSRAFLFVSNMAKINIVSLNNEQPTAAKPLQMTDVIRMGHTQLLFVAFCEPEFDWSDLAGLKNG